MWGELQQDVVQTLEICSGDLSSVAAVWRDIAADLQALDRSGEPEHFTASALPISPDAARVCLVHHRRMGRWVQPGGHFEPGDSSVVAAAAREMAEETGLSAPVDPIPIGLSRHPAPCRSGAWHLDLQMLAVTAEQIPVVSDESEAVAWFPVGRLPQPLAHGVEELVARAAARLSRSGSGAVRSPGE